MFDEHYLEDPSVQWSFFPLGIGSKGGILIKILKRGKIEHVVGIDVDSTNLNIVRNIIFLLVKI